MQKVATLHSTYAKAQEEESEIGVFATEGQTFNCFARTESSFI